MDNRRESLIDQDFFSTIKEGQVSESTTTSEHLPLLNEWRME